MVSVLSCVGEITLLCLFLLRLFLCQILLITLAVLLVGCNNAYLCFDNAFCMSGI